jgi:catechol 2,3-dioxygenase-like lactoylglutathione lyase family enzyme
MTRTIPALPVVNIAVATAFYASKLGFQTVHAEDGFAIVKRDDAVIHLWAASDDRWRARLGDVLDGRIQIDRSELSVVVSGAETFLAGTASCRIEVTGIDMLHAEYRESGVLYSANTRVEHQPWGDRDFPALDLHRNLLTFFERGPGR